MKNKAVLGKFEGKCCDADVVNNNGMFLSRELFDSVLNSDEYRTAINNRYYIGFLGHPEDPNCMDFRNACVVMTDMRMDSNGDVYGSFDLVDTPVGRVVKAFVDAGVKFGISIRGAGDVASDGTVDPETFVFRGFDLVTFPAYEDCVPEFQRIAASSDAEQAAKYKKICSAITTNVRSINSSEALRVIEDQLNSNSPEFKAVQDRRMELEDVQPSCDVKVKVLESSVKSLVREFCNVVRDRDRLMEELRRKSADMESDARKQDRVCQILCSQARRFRSSMISAEDRARRLEKRVTACKEESRKWQLKAEKSELRARSLKNKNSSLVSASSEYEKKIREFESKNLLSDKRAEQADGIIAEKDKRISSLEDELRETVTQRDKLSEDASNCEEELDSLRRKVQACEDMLLEYQQACADSFAYAAGVRVDNVPVTSSTTVDELRSYIYSRAGSCSSSSAWGSCPEESEETNVELDESNVVAL